MALMRAQGFIQMGSRFDSNSDNLAQHPKPVLTLSGGLDGQITPAAIAKHASEVVATEYILGKQNTWATKPVVIIPGMNHAQFSNGTVNFQRGDLLAELSYKDAQRRAAELVAAFLAVQSEGPHGAAGARGLEILREAVEETHTRYRPLWEALENQTGGAAAHQVYVASTPSVATGNVTCMHHDFKENFVVSKPWIDKENNRVFVTTCLSMAGKYGLCNLSVKMKSQEAVLAHFGVQEHTKKHDPAVIATLGKEINIQTFNEAMALVSDDARERFLAKGKKLRFVDDLIIQGPATVWIESDLSFKASGSGDIEVQTPVLNTPESFKPTRFAGMHYMKVLTLARAIHWILVDSFR